MLSSDTLLTYLVHTTTCFLCVPVDSAYSYNAYAKARADANHKSSPPSASAVPSYLPHRPSEGFSASARTREASCAQELLKGLHTYLAVFPPPCWGCGGCGVRCCRRIVGGGPGCGIRTARATPQRRSRLATGCARALAATGCGRRRRQSRSGIRATSRGAARCAAPSAANTDMPANVYRSLCRWW